MVKETWSINLMKRFLEAHDMDKEWNKSHKCKTQCGFSYKRIWFFDCAQQFVFFVFPVIYIFLIAVKSVLDHWEATFYFRGHPKLIKHRLAVCLLEGHVC